MSETTTTTAVVTRVTFAQRVLAGARSHEVVRHRFPDLASIPHSSEVLAAGEQLAACAARSIEGQAAVVARTLRSLTAATSVGAAVTALGDFDLRAAAGRIGNLEVGRMDATEVGTLRTALVGATRRTATALAADERLVIVAAARELLGELGFEVAAVDGVGSTTLQATARPRHIAVLVRDGGHLTIDVAGCEGGSCRPIVRRFFDALARRGIDVTALIEDNHRDPRGGTLIRRATGGQVDPGGRERAATRPTSSSSAERTAR